VLLLVTLLHSTFAGVFHSPGFIFQQQPSNLYPTFQYPVQHYPAPSFASLQRPQQQQFVATVSRPQQQQFLSPGRPQFVAIQAQRPQVVSTSSRPQFVSVQAQRPQSVTSIVSSTVSATQAQTPAAVAVPVQQQQQFSNVVAIQAERPTLRKYVFPLPPNEVYTQRDYSYEYGVKDVTTGDEKSHTETRTGDNVVGRYTVVEPDGSLRIVSYTAGKGGFNAVVERTAGYAPPNAPAKGIAVAVAKPVAATAVAVPVSGASFTYPYPSANEFHFGG
jgi:hypothetical protein